MTNDKKKYRHSDERKQKISAASKAHWEDEETRQKILRGIKESITDEVRAQRSRILKEKWKDPEFRKKMSDRMKQRYSTQEARDAHSKLMKKVCEDDPTILERRSKSLKKTMASQEYREKRRQLSKNIWDESHRKHQSELSQAMWDNFTEQERKKFLKKLLPSRVSSIEIKVQNQLKEKGIEYISQYPILGGKYWLDIYIPSFNIAIECNGDYWHHRQERIKRDEELAKDITKTNIHLITLWESIIKKSDFDVMDYIKEDKNNAFTEV